jgi:hypothetical protein
MYIIDIHNITDPFRRAGGIFAEIGKTPGHLGVRTSRRESVFQMTLRQPETWTLHELLDVCSDCASVHWESGWREFLRRYRLFVYNSVAKSCAAWNMPRLRRQFSETVNDIVSDVVLVLCRNRCRSLQNFLGRDEEKIFLAWLATVCRRAAGHHIQRYFAQMVGDGDFDEAKDYMGRLSYDARWELRETVVATLRTLSGGRKLNGERDILLFQLSLLADLPASLILSLPCFNQVGPRVLSNVTHRLRQRLRKQKERLTLEDA